MSENIVQSARYQEMSEEITGLQKQLAETQTELQDLKAGIVPVHVESVLSDNERQHYEDEITSLQAQQIVLLEQNKDSIRTHFEIKEIGFQKRIDELNIALANKQSQLEGLQASCNNEKSKYQKLHKEYTEQINQHQKNVFDLHKKLDSSEEKIHQVEQRYANAIFALSDQQKVMQSSHPRFTLMFFLSLFIFIAGLLIGASAIYLWVNPEKTVTIIEQPMHHTKVLRIQADCSKPEPIKTFYRAKKAPKPAPSKILQIVNSDDPLAGL